MTAAARPLTPKQAAFVEEYLVDLNATQAAVRAGFSARTAEQQGYRLLRNIQVAAAIAERKAKRIERLEITQDRVLAELGKIGFSDVRKVFTGGGSLRRIEDLDDETAGALSSIEVVRRRVPGSDRDQPEYEDVTKIRLWDKRAALVDLGKHLGMFKEEISMKIGLEAWVLHSLAPAQGQPPIDGEAKIISKE